MQNVVFGISSKDIYGLRYISVLEMQSKLRFHQEKSLETLCFTMVRLNLRT